MAPESERAMIQKFRKKPVVIEAVQVWANSEWPANVRYDENQGGFAVYDRLHDTWVKFESGDWIITGVKGETYPCKPDVFAATYDAAENSEQTPETNEGQTNPTEPTLTCSEVVERLRCQVVHQGYPAGTTCITKRDFAIREPQTFQRTYHEEIVAKKHYCNDCYATDQIEWRERRVQELEDLLAKHSISLNSADSASNTESSRIAKETR